MTDQEFNKVVGEFWALPPKEQEKIVQAIRDGKEPTHILPDQMCVVRDLGFGHGSC